MKRELICIICPRGCLLSAEQTDHSWTVTGNACPRGARYAIDECTCPVRTVTATVRVANRPDTMASVKTQTPVPKERMPEVMAALRRITVQAPLHLGQRVLSDICGTNIIVTKAVL